MRIEKDCIGTLAVPDEALYGIHTQRALNNFPISNEKTSKLIVHSMVSIKMAAAITNAKAGTLDQAKADAIVHACKDLLLGKYADQFIIPAFQGGAGTSTNMNVNEVIAHLASKKYYAGTIHPNDDVNQSQSTNDTYPTAGKMAILQLVPNLISELDQMEDTLAAKAEEFKDDIKVGRTQLEDAVPTTFGSSFHAYYSMILRDVDRIKRAADHLRVVNLGGTAIGTGLNASDYYREHVVTELNKITNYKLSTAADLIDATQNCDDYVEFSGALKTLALNLIKIANDLRLLGSGPQAGLSELILPAKQAGSSIMPGKVNPVIPEVVNQIAFEVIGHDTTVGLATQAGQLELNAFEPVIFRDILESEAIISQGMHTLTINCLEGIKIRREKSRSQVENSAISATILAPIIGYEKSMQLIKSAIHDHRSIKELLSEQDVLDDATIERLFSADSLLNRTEQVKIASTN